MKKKDVLKKTEKSSKPQTVDEYIANIPKEERSALENLRNIIKATVPEAEEVISYGIPTYKYYGPLVHFATFKDHSSFIVINELILETFKSELEGYKTSGTTIHFSTENPLSESLVKEIVKKRMEENEARANK